MNEPCFYFKYSEQMKEKYGQKVYKIPVNLPVSCPVRDGSISSEGCIFCGEKAAGHESLANTLTPAMQIQQNIHYIAPNYGAKLFEIYFQNFTNTYLPPAAFEAYLRDGIHADDRIVRIGISTRPDCISEEYLMILKKISEEFGLDISIELGLQSVNASTLRIINRGHGLAEYIDAVLSIRPFRFEVCTHLITSLPWDTRDDIIEAAKILSVLHTNSVKLHSLYVEKGTPLAAMYLSGGFQPIALPEYIARTADFLEYLDPGISVQRLSARVPEEVSLFANWGRSHWVLQDMILDELRKRGSFQGRKSGYGCDAQVRKFFVY